MCRNINGTVTRQMREGLIQVYHTLGEIQRQRETSDILIPKEELTQVNRQVEHLKEENAKLRKELDQIKKRNGSFTKKKDVQSHTDIY